MKPLSLLLVAGLGLAACQSAPPPPVVAPPVIPEPTSPVSSTDVLQARLMSDVRVLAADSLEGRGAGTEGGAKARLYLEERFRGIGLEPMGEDGYRQLVPLQSGAEAVNLVGRIPGTVHPQRVLVVTAHYDHLGVRRGEIYNGADDNASGVAALLDVARRFTEAPPKHTIIFVAFDAEEQGLVGARHFVANSPVPLGAILATVNFDMVSRGDTGALWVAGTAHYPHLGDIIESVVASAPVTVRFGHDTGSGSDNWTSASDHGAFHQRDVPFLYFGVEDHADYHRESDEVDKIDPVFFAGAAEAIWSAVHALDEDHAALASGR
ncbi:MAG: M20/M25/M40 family metallo-hydrolase [Rubricoccaceae bacterium]